MIDCQKLQSRIRTGNALIRFAGIVLLFSSLIKFAHPAKPVAYMSFLGYQDGKMLLVAAIEIVVGALFLWRATRPLGLLLVSSYFGGAIAAHLASHPLNSSAPIVVFNFHHPYLGALPAVVMLATAWIGVYFRHPEARWNATGIMPPVSPETSRSAMRTAA
ncbi:MAG TPA: DoxX family protein [Bryobacteraceae bacterium]|jgi:hypothetical protein|nr:DoxX family protein [Bryobacteraceae bacterium]